MGKGAKQGNVQKDRPDADYGAGSWPVASLTRADKIYLWQASVMVPNLHAIVLKGTKDEIKNAINAVGSGSGAGTPDQIDPSDGRGDNDVSAQVTPAFKAVVDAAVAAAPNRHGTAAGHPKLTRP
jgi:hypothetical protein